jgi:hypothetical protein
MHASWSEPSWLQDFPPFDQQVNGGQEATDYDGHASAPEQ